MSPSYVPVIAAKKGEFDALRNLHSLISEKTFPLFEIPPKKPESTLIEPPIDRTAKAAGKSWKNRSAFLDISKWRPNAKTESRIHVLEYAFSQFISEGVHVSPVIGYDRFDDPAYRLALGNIIEKYPNTTPCIRFDRESIKDDMRDEDYFSEQITDILETFDLNPSSCYAMLDFRDVSTTAIPDLVGHAEHAIQVLQSVGFKMIIFAGGSMPTTVDNAVKDRDSDGCIARIEMLTWKTISSSKGNKSIIFGDYPIRNPDAADGIIAIHANAKIRYTIKNQFFVVRGHSKKEDSLGLQHKILAAKMISSMHYAGPAASWGDGELQKCALGIREIKEATSMIAIDTNCHITAVVREIFEHQRSISLAKKTV